MDTVSHALLGALAARASAPRVIPAQRLDLNTRTWVGALSAAFPDIDYLTFWIDPLAFLADWHRGPTHSLLLLPLWALLLGVSFAIVIQRIAQWRELSVISGLGLLTQIGADATTVFGTQLFAPLSHYRAALGVIFDIAPYLGLVLGIALIASVLWHSRLIALLGLIAVVAIIGMQALFKQQLSAVAQRYAATHGFTAAIIHVLPQPWSPFYWNIIVSENGRYHQAMVNVLADQRPSTSGNHFLSRLVSAYQPLSTLSWTQRQAFGEPTPWHTLVNDVWQDDKMSGFRRFAQLPSLYRIDDDPHQLCIWFTDLRYTFAGMPPAFRFGMCRANEDRQWRAYRLRYFTDNERQLLQ